LKTRFCFCKNNKRTIIRRIITQTQRPRTARALDGLTARGEDEFFIRVYFCT